MRIRWTEPAARDLTAICDFTDEHDGPEAARRIADPSFFSWFAGNRHQSHISMPARRMQSKYRRLMLCAVPASNLRPKHDPYRNLQSRSYVSECTPVWIASRLRCLGRMGHRGDGCVCAVHRDRADHDNGRVPQALARRL